MTPHSYSLDSQSKSFDLAGKFTGANSPAQISAAVSAVESHLTAHSPDQNRHFFSLAFPALLCKFFGFDVSSSSSQNPTSPVGWIDTVSFSNDSDLAGKLFNLLSPHGTLMNSIVAVDRLSLVKFVFPVERLPEWVRFLLTSERDCRILSDLCPLFKGRINEDEIKGNFQVHLNIFEYLVFWFAYYPVCRGKCENSGTVSVKSSRKSKLENWTSSIPVISSSSKRPSEQKSDCNLYLKLLYAYLRAFVPMDDMNSHHQPYRSSLLHYSASCDDSVVLRAEFLVETLVNYWLVDSDFSPLAVNVCKSFGLSFPFRSVLGETPPASGLGEVVKLLVKYLNLNSAVVTDGSKHVEYGGSPLYKKLGSSDFIKTREASYVLPSLPSGASWNSYVQRPLYRFILRTFLYCPMGSSMKNMREVFSVWISYIEPWRLCKEEFSELDAMADASKIRSDKDSDDPNQRQYSINWQGYVLSNYLFYTSLVMHFIGFAHKFLHTDAEVIVQMISRVTDILISSRELMELIKNVDAIFHSRNAGSGRLALSNFNKFVPQIREQLQDWEDGLSESDADGSFLHENWNRDLRLFSNGEDGGSQLLQLFILRAETELQAISCDNLANNLQCLHSLKPKLRCLFGDHVVMQSPVSPRTEQLQHSRDELFKPRRFGKGLVANDNYKGDWLRRPISDDEVAWLAMLLIHISSWLNQNLGLYQGGLDVSCPYVELPTDVVNEYGMSDFLKAAICPVASWFLAVRLLISRLLIRHGLKVNLRVFASKKFVTVVLLFAVFSMMRRAFRSIW